MKYIVDIDALCRCINLLPTNTIHDNVKGFRTYVKRSDVLDLINAFPKDELKTDKKLINESTTCIREIDDGK